MFLPQLPYITDGMFYVNGRSSWRSPSTRRGSTTVCRYHIIFRLKFETADDFHLFYVLYAEVCNDTNLILTPAYYYITFFFESSIVGFVEDVRGHVTEQQKVWVYTKI